MVSWEQKLVDRATSFQSVTLRPSLPIFHILLNYSCTVSIIPKSKRSYNYCMHISCMLNISSFLGSWNLFRFLQEFIIMYFPFAYCYWIIYCSVLYLVANIREPFFIFQTLNGQGIRINLIYNTPGGYIVRRMLSRTRNYSCLP